MNNLDVVATIVDMAGASPGFVLDGRSLTPIFADAHAPWRSAIAFESPVSRFRDASDRYTGLRIATQKYIRYDSGVEKLYDLAADPLERKNRAGKAAYAGDLARLRSLNDKLKTCTGATCFVP